MSSILFSAAVVVAILGASSPSATSKKTASPARATSASKTAAATKPAPPDSAAVVALLAGVSHPTCPLEGVATGGQVGEATVKGLAGAGFKTVLDLRAPEESRGFDEAGAMKKAGLDYVVMPVNGGTLDDAMFDRVRAFMQEGEHYPVMVHCASGNRVGVVLLPWLVLDRGWSLDRAMAAAAQAGTHPSPLLDRALSYIGKRQVTR